MQLALIVPRDAGDRRQLPSLFRRRLSSPAATALLPAMPGGSARRHANPAVRTLFAQDGDSAGSGRPKLAAPAIQLPAPKAGDDDQCRLTKRRRRPSLRPAKLAVFKIRRYPGPAPDAAQRSSRRCAPTTRRISRKGLRDGPHRRPSRAFLHITAPGEAGNHCRRRRPLTTTTPASAAVTSM